MTDTTEQKKIFAWAGGPGVKAALVGVLLLILLIPLNIVQSLVEERSQRSAEVIADIGAVWGHEQRVQGPHLVVPYNYAVPGAASGTSNVKRRIFLLLPEKLEIDGTVDVQSRSISLYQANVYTAKLTMTAHYRLPELLTHPNVSEPFYEEMLAGLMLGDVQGLQGDIEISANGTPLKILPGAGYGKRADFGVHGRVPRGIKPGDSVVLVASFSLRGSEALNIWPSGAKSDITLSSAWPSPGFQGRFSPVTRTVSDKGFTANWQTLRLAQGIGPVLDENHARREYISVRFVDPVNRYSMAERSVKYGSLFVLMTFAVLYLFEVISGRRVHPVQYMLTGLALCLFFLSLLALAEHLSFGAAYALSAAIIIGLVTAYARSVTRSSGWAIGILGTLAALFGYLYGVLLLEDMALLAGTTLLIVAIAGAMWLTRRVDWYGAK